jgi:putative flavoprotein involved in K+ transport
MYKIFSDDSDHFNTIIIGAGQAGLALGYYLKQQNENFIIVDAGAEIGHSWYHRWDSLKLFTPDWSNSLPGKPFPKTKGKFPGKDEMAQYLWNYAHDLKLPVRLNTRVFKLTRYFAGYRLQTSSGNLTCKNVVVASGNFSKPYIPELASLLSPNIRQLHSSEYHNASGLPPGSVLVVGAGTSGLQIALDIAASGRRTYVSGNPPSKVPDFAVRYLSRFSLWFMKNVLTVDTKAGRKAEYKIKHKGHASPLINISLKKVVAAGVSHLPKLERVSDGYPFFSNEKAQEFPLHVDAIVWCTGYRPDLSWIDLENAVDAQGYPLSRKGVATYYDGLYFMGMMFQYALASVMINGVGRDARYIAHHIVGPHVKMPA